MFHSFRVSDSHDEAPGASSGSSPFEIPDNCIFWFKADEGVTTSSPSITNWADQSGNFVDLDTIQKTAPLFVEDAMNGHPVVRIDDGGIYTSNANDVMDNLPGFFIAIAYKPISPPNIRTLLQLITSGEAVTTPSEESYQFISPPIESI